MKTNHLTVFREDKSVLENSQRNKQQLALDMKAQGTPNNTARTTQATSAENVSRPISTSGFRSR